MLPPLAADNLNTCSPYPLLMTLSSSVPPPSVPSLSLLVASCFPFGLATLPRSCGTQAPSRLALSHPQRIGGFFFISFSKFSPHSNSYDPSPFRLWFSSSLTHRFTSISTLDIVSSPSWFSAGRFFHPSPAHFPENRLLIVHHHHPLKASFALCVGGRKGFVA